MFIAALFVLAPNSKPKFLSTGGWINCSVSTQWKLFSDKIEQTTLITHNMHESLQHCKYQKILVPSNVQVTPKKHNYNC